MDQVYYLLIKAKMRSIETIPSHLRESVLVILNANGLDGNGDPLEENIEE